MEKNLEFQAWIGLFRDGKEWLWANGEETNDFFYWRRGDPEGDSTTKYATLRFDLFGGGWDDVQENAKRSFLICSNR